ncbi:MAG: tetratricopeptide repeat protein [Bryobacter sp.]|jgi:tetratricopeptide (TPR) repeat protein|nr:tetratricopeptide repeat protein [Bryobacter sp.]
MSNWVFVDVPPGAVEGLADVEFPFPIRRENVAAYEVQAAEEFPLLLLVDELDLYLDEFPARIERYRKPGAHLALCAGIDACIESCTEQSLDYYRLAVFLDPGNLTARMNYAVALHSLEQREPAIEQYRAIMARGGIHEWWRAWLLCAEALMALGRNEEAFALLREAEPTVPDDDQFWDTLARCEQRMQPRCPQCGEVFEKKLRFCGYCGARLA